MELWQWVSLSGVHLHSYLAPAEQRVLAMSAGHPFETENWVQVGDALEASCLVYPLVYGVRNSKFEDTQFSLKDPINHEILDHWTLHLNLHKDDGSLDPITNESMPALKVMSILAEFAGCLTEAVDRLGWNFVSFAPDGTAGGFSLTIERPTSDTIGGILRGVVLMRACIESLSFARGFKLLALGVQILPQFILDVDDALAETLKKIYMHQPRVSE